MTSKKSFQRLSQIFQDVEAICALDSLRSTGDSSRGIFSSPIPAYHLDFWMLSHPGRSWSEPILPDTEGSQLPGTGRERASNSTGGRYPKLECRLLVFYTSSMKTAKFASASAKDSSSLR